MSASAPDHLPALARGMWTLTEPIHAVTYFSPEASTAFTAAGLRGFWRGYFAGRSAPLGRVGPEAVTALFFNFAPGMVARALPAVWDLAGPEAALAARQQASAATLRRAFAEAHLEPDVPALADRLWAIAAAAPTDGRALGAANAGLPRPDDAHERLWLAASILRELRGDGHVAALVTAGLSGLDILVLRSAADLERQVLQPARGWSDEDWTAGTAALTAGGLLGGPGGPARPTEAGWAVLTEVERITDRLAGAAWAGSAAAGDLHDLAARLRPLAAAAATVFPPVNPIGISAAWDPESAPDGVPWAGSAAR
jgi:hypothetical protein